MGKKYNVVAAGRAYTDIIAEVSADFLQAHSIPLDGQRACSAAEIKCMQAAMANSQFVAGGASANTVALVAVLGGKAGFFGKVYDDAAGNYFFHDLTASQVAWCCAAYSPTPASALCLVLLKDDHRSFAFNPGCSDNFTEADFAGFDFANTDFFLLEAHLLTSHIASAAIVKAIQIAKDQTSIVINLQGIVDWSEFSDTVKIIASAAHVVIGNRDEQSALDYAMNILQVSRSATQLMITTQGKHGAELSQAGNIVCVVAAVPPKKFVNSLGAGDAFIAGFLFARARGMNLGEAMQFAVETATVILEEPTARLKTE